MTDRTHRQTETFDFAPDFRRYDVAECPASADGSESAADARVGNAGDATVGAEGRA
jgi:hypothetical protein